MRYNQQKEYLEWNTQDGVSSVARVHEGSELSNVIERRKWVLSCGDDDGRGIAPPTSLGILGNAGQAPIANRFNSSTRHHPTTGVVLSSTLKQDSCGFNGNTNKKQWTVDKEPIQTNTADGFTKALRTPKFLEWRNLLGVGYDNGDDVETSKREALAESGRWARVEALHAIPRSVLIATLMQQTFATGRRGWNDWNWLSKA